MWVIRNKSPNHPVHIRPRSAEPKPSGLVGLVEPGREGGRGEAGGGVMCISQVRSGAREHKQRGGGGEGEDLVHRRSSCWNINGQISLQQVNDILMASLSHNHKLPIDLLNCAPYCAPYMYTCIRLCTRLGSCLCTHSCA